MPQVKYLHEVDEIAEGIRFLQRSDPVFSRIAPYTGHLWPRFDPGFPGLVRIVLGQQVSIRAASALWERLDRTINPLTPENVLAAEASLFREAGLSRQKSSYIIALASSISGGSLDLQALRLQDDAEVIGTITKQKGFGVWSAQMYLMFALARPNVWPAGDLGIQIGLRNYFSLQEKPDAKETETMRQKFEPHCTAASLLLWHMNLSLKEKRQPYE